MWCAILKLGVSACVVGPLCMPVCLPCVSLLSAFVHCTWLECPRGLVCLLMCAFLRVVFVVAQLGEMTVLCVSVCSRWHVCCAFTSCDFF